MSEPSSVGIDARMLSPSPTGVGNYIATLLHPLCEAHPQTRFFLYSCFGVEFSGHTNVVVREGGPTVGPLWMNLTLPSALAKDCIDVFWGANGVAPCLGKTPPSVVTVHDLVYRFAGETMGRGNRWNKTAFQRWSVRRAKQVVAVSQATANDVASFYGRSVDAVLRPLASAEYTRQSGDCVRSVRERLLLPEDFWLFAGTLEPRKNLVSLLEAYLQEIDAGQRLPVLALAGKRGWGDERLNRLIARGESSGQVRRLGYVSIKDLSALYSGCTLLWMPSLCEGFGMPLLEAQRCGAAVVHGDHASMCEAADSLGIATGTSVSALRQTIGRIVRGEAPLACRTFSTNDDEVGVCSEALWHCFCRAMHL